MRWNINPSSSRRPPGTPARGAMMLAAGSLSVIACACQHTLKPFQDELPPTEAISTASADGVRASGKTAEVRQRSWKASQARYAHGGVTHWPLWWEDPFEDQGSQDGVFAWTWEDYLAWPYSFGRFLLNTMAWPVSAVVTPPGTVMISDGRLSRQALRCDHDAERYPPSQADRQENEPACPEADSPPE